MNPTWLTTQAFPAFNRSYPAHGHTDSVSSLSHEFYLAHHRRFPFVMSSISHTIGVSSLSRVLAGNTIRVSSLWWGLSGTSPAFPVCDEANGAHHRRFRFVKSRSWHTTCVSSLRRVLSGITLHGLATLRVLQATSDFFLFFWGGGEGVSPLRHSTSWDRFGSFNKFRAFFSAITKEFTPFYAITTWKLKSFTIYMRHTYVAYQTIMYCLKKARSVDGTDCFIFTVH
jgi:hypothetical protein